MPFLCNLSKTKNVFMYEIYVLNVSKQSFAVSKNENVLKKDLF